MRCYDYFGTSMMKFVRTISKNISNACKFNYLVLLVIMTWSSSSAISLDTHYPLIFEDISGGNSYFGFTVLLFSEKGKKNSWIQIGAPRANLSFGRNFFEPGGVYRCQLSPHQFCKPIIVAGKGISITPGEEKRDGSWLGAAMDIQPGPSGQLAVCSPRWTHSYQSHFMPGACYWNYAERDGNSTFETLLPLFKIEKYSQKSSRKADVPNFAYGEAGFSVHFPLEKPIEAKSKLVIGTPGLFNWKGGFVIYEGAPANNDASNRARSSKLRYPTQGIARFKDGDYTGYQVNSGYFFRKDRLLFVVGAPRAEAAKGKVLLLYIVVKSDAEFNANVRLEILGSQCGEYFGSSIAIGDLNGDSFDDLIVGAPFYSSDDVMLPDYDRGRIAIYLSVSNNQDKGQPYVREVGQIFGYKFGGRFGSAITYLGDINSDSKPEIAVGAPYEDEHRGAIYIYTSDPEGRLGNPVQRLAARDTYDVLKGFGISISPHNVDIDRNGCADIAVGAYLSGHAVIYRGKPVITWDVHDPEPYPKAISHDATEFSLNFACVTYLGENAPNHLKIRRRLELDLRCKEVLITEDITLERAVALCHNFTIALKPNIRDVLNPIEVKISYELIKNEDVKNYVLFKKDDIRGKDSFCEKCPVSASSPSYMFTIPFKVSCGGDALCTADLTISGELPELQNQSKKGIFPFVTGSSSTLLFQVIVKNLDKADTAYFTHVYIEIGFPGSLSRFLTECREIPSLPNLNFTQKADGDNSTQLSHKSTFIECETGDILPHEEKHISIEVDMTSLQGHNEMLLAAWATTINSETNSSDNEWKGKVQLNNEADLTIFGKGVPEINSITFDAENVTGSKINFIHYYEVQKFGHSQVQEAIIQHQIPMYIIDKKSKEKIKFLTLKDYKGYQGRQTLSCSLGENLDLDDEIKVHSISKRSEVASTSKVSRSEVSSNRTLYVNCSSPAISDTHVIECHTVSCNLGPLTSSQTMAKFSLKMEIDAPKLKHLMGTRHIIFLKTHGVIKVIDPKNLQQPPDDKPDHATAHSIFVADAPKKKIETWVYAMAIGAGIMIVLFLQMALAKAGFFKRKKKHELKELKRQTLMMISEDFLLQQRLRERSEDKEKEEKDTQQNGE